MSSLSAVGLSGMNAAQTALSDSAGRIASVAVAPSQVRSPSAGAASSAASLALADDMIRQLQARNAFLANLAVFRSGDAMAGALLNLRA